MAGEPLKLIVGLGNPGIEYARTRHNAGFQVVDELARRHQATFRSEPRHQAELARARIGGEDLWLLKPMSYMNRSGDPVRSVADYYKVPVESVLVAYDELDFPAGVVRLKQGGGAAGHNGMRDVIAHMGDAFWRLRIGIGHPGDRSAVLDYVLGRPNAADAELIRDRKSTRLNSSHVAISYAVFCLKQPPTPAIYTLSLHDALPISGVVRLKQGGGAAGHNGMRDVIAHMGDAFWRLRIGIGHPGDRSAVLDYVLGRPNAADAELIREALLVAADAVPVLLTEGAQSAMNRLHSRGPSPGEPPATNS